MRQRIVFDEVSVKGVYTWRDENGKKRQETRKFWQTVNPFNCNEDGSVKTREQIYAELNAERDEWLREKRQS